MFHDHRIVASSDMSTRARPTVARVRKSRPVSLLSFLCRIGWTAALCGSLTGLFAWLFRCLEDPFIALILSLLLPVSIAPMLTHADRISRR